jgi:hypothetical protein
MVIEDGLDMVELKVLITVAMAVRSSKAPRERLLDITALYCVVTASFIAICMRSP